MRAMRRSPAATAARSEGRRSPRWSEDRRTLDQSPADRPVTRPITLNPNIIQVIRSGVTEISAISDVAYKLQLARRPAVSPPTKQRWRNKKDITIKTPHEKLVCGRGSGGGCDSPRDWSRGDEEKRPRPRPSPDTAESWFVIY
jgi:hypothetical protein